MEFQIEEIKNMIESTLEVDNNGNIVNKDLLAKNLNKFFNDKKEEILEYSKYSFEYNQSLSKYPTLF